MATPRKKPAGKKAPWKAQAKRAAAELLAD
jgi:hypothetical protein